MLTGEFLKEVIVKRGQWVKWSPSGKVEFVCWSKRQGKLACYRPDGAFSHFIDNIKHDEVWAEFVSKPEVAQ